MIDDVVNTCFECNIAPIMNIFTLIVDKYNHNNLLRCKRLDNPSNCIGDIEAQKIISCSIVTTNRHCICVISN
uniref:Saposin B-type domain-containing protein n=1 Tax=Strongyloides venezuelensis TaxID=75913 RepID=A0A0K0EYZ0_STRVS